MTSCFVLRFACYSLDTDTEHGSTLTGIQQHLNSTRLSRGSCTCVIIYDLGHPLAYRRSGQEALLESHPDRITHTFRAHSPLNTLSTPSLNTRKLSHYHTHIHTITHTITLSHTLSHTLSRYHTTLSHYHTHYHTHYHAITRHYHIITRHTLLLYPQLRSPRGFWRCKRYGDF